MRAPCLLVVLVLVSATSCGSGSDSGGVLEERGNPAESADPEWWLSSGALFFREAGGGRTIQGELPADSSWRLAYASSNPGDSDGGFHPQNVFRLVNVRGCGDCAVAVSFRVTRTQASASPNRNGSNGVFLLQRYRGENDLYAAGVRVDGAAVIKKKIAGRNVTLGQAPFYSNGAPYDRSANPNVLPQGRAIALRVEAVDQADGVSLRLLVDGLPAVQTVDRGAGGPPLRGAGFLGLRSDFMDVEFTSYRVEPLR